MQNTHTVVLKPSTLLHRINCKIINSSKCSIVRVLRDYRISNDLMSVSAYFVYNCKFRGNALYERDFATNRLNNTHITGTRQCLSYRGLKFDCNIVLILCTKFKAYCDARGFTKNGGDFVDGA